MIGEENQNQIENKEDNTISKENEDNGNKKEDEVEAKNEIKEKEPTKELNEEIKDQNENQVNDLEKETDKNEINIEPKNGNEDDKKERTENNDEEKNSQKKEEDNKDLNENKNEINDNNANIADKNDSNNNEDEKLNKDNIIENNNPKEENKINEETKKPENKNSIKDSEEENKNVINLNKIEENNDNDNGNKINEEKKESENKNVININEKDENNGNEIKEDLKKAKLQESKDDDKYLVNLEEEKELQNLINEQLKNNMDEEDSDDDEEETFPFRFLGDVKKKGEILGIFNNRYLEIDSVKGLLKRYASSKEYPQNPMEVIPITSLKTLKKVKKVKGQEFFEFQLTYIPPNKTKEKLHIYHVRHAECRSKWFDSLLKLWKHLVKNEPLPPINRNKLIFIDDQVGINQEIKQNKKKKKESTNPSNLVCLRNFKVLGILGVGGFGTVFKVQHILTEKIYAMKVMNKNYIIQKKYLHYVVGEFEIMKMLSGFPFVIDLHYCFQTANYLYMIIDICPGGDFADIKSVNNMKLFLAEVILAFEHIHNHHVVYRDLKPENILLDTTGHIKICDFNLAKANISKQKKATSFCGSPMYLSPEMLDPEGVDQRADIYGIGLLIYELITDRPAYKADNLNQLYEKIKANQIDFNNPKLEGDIKDLLQKILVADPEERISIEEIKRHPYFKDISFLKVYKKEYGPIEIIKKDKSEIDEKDKIFSKNILEGKTEEEAQKEKQEEEKKSEDKFKEEQKKLDANKEYSFLDGKITVREMKKDQKRAMKNYVREFYYVKKEDTPQTEEFQLTVNGILNTNDI